MNFAKNMRMRGNCHLMILSSRLVAATSSWLATTPCASFLPTVADVFSSVILSSIIGWCMLWGWVSSSTLCIWAVIVGKASCTPWKRSCIPNWCQGNLWVLWHHSCLDTVWRLHMKLWMLTQRRNGQSRKEDAQDLALQVLSKGYKLA